MKDFLLEFLSGPALLSFGFGLSLTGAIVWMLPRYSKKTFAMRDTYVKHLREAGEEERARKVDAETAVILGRIPVYGRALIIVGVLVIVAGIIRLT